MLNPKHTPEIHEWLKGILEVPSLYEELLALLAHQGCAVPESILGRDWFGPHQPSEEVHAGFKKIYEDLRQCWTAYEMCEKLADV